MSKVWDDTPCELGEGPLWHPEREQLFWFDILGCRLLTREDGQTRHWQFDETVSAGGWIDDTRLLIASETRLFIFDVESGAREDVVALDADDPETRSNDGRADPWGGFWIGTMAKDGRGRRGAFFRYYRGELRQLYGGIGVTNACCFSPDRKHAYFTDTDVGIVRRVTLDPDDGWPAAEPEDWLDLSDQPWRVDGAVIDAEGDFWNAQWGGWRVARYSPGGVFKEAFAVGGAHSSCPGFGGPDLTTLFVTTARTRVPAEDLRRAPDGQGLTYAIENAGRGQREHRVEP